MNVHFIRIPTHDDGRASEPLNTFLSGRRIVSIDREFLADGTNSFWAVAVVWTAGSTFAPVATTRDPTWRRSLGCFRLPGQTVCVSEWANRRCRFKMKVVMPPKGGQMYASVPEGKGA